MSVQKESTSINPNHRVINWRLIQGRVWPLTTTLWHFRSCATNKTTKKKENGRSYGPVSIYLRVFCTLSNMPILLVPFGLLQKDSRKKPGSQISHKFGSFYKSWIHFSHHIAEKKLFLPSKCIGRKELSHVHIKPHAMTRAMKFDKGRSESEIVYWSEWGCILM